MTPVIYKTGMTKLDLFNAVAMRIPEICRLWGIPVPVMHPQPHPQHNRRYGTGGTLFGLYYGNKIWVNVAESSKPVVKRGRAWSFPGNKTDRTASGILFHEFGHHVSACKHMNTQEWRDICKREHVTGYEPVPEEALAETLRVFSSNPELLRLACPKRYAYVTKFVQPWHSATWRQVLQNAPDFIVDNAAKWAKQSDSLQTHNKPLFLKGKTTMTNNETKIKVLSKDHDKTRGKGLALDTLLRCKTVAAFRASLAKKEMGHYVAWALRVAQRDKLVKLEA